MRVREVEGLRFIEPTKRNGRFLSGGWPWLLISLAGWPKIEARRSRKQVLLTSAGPRAMRCDAMRQEKLHDDGIERPEMAMMGDW